MDAPHRPAALLSWSLLIALVFAGTPVESQVPADPTISSVLAKVERLDTVRAINDLAEEADREAKSVVWFVRAVTGQLAGVRDEALETANDPGHALPSQAVQALFERVGNPDGADPEELAKLDALPELLRLAILDIFNAFIAFDEAAERLPAWQAASTVWDPATVQLLAARSTLLEAVAAYEVAHQSVQNELTLDEAIRMPPVFAYDPIGEDSIYTDDYMLLIDTGGDDYYFNNAGGSGLRPVDTVYWNVDPCSIWEPYQNRVGFEGAAALIDYSGNDRYGMGHACGVNGGGNGGAGFLYDGEGRDQYLAADSPRCQMFHLSGQARGSCGANGGGYRGGVGFLLDVSGRDVYEGTNGGVNGGGYVGGIGFLFDITGYDTYKATSAGVNGGGHALGYGFLYDGTGSDYYEGTFAGVNGGGDGGSGLLIDRWGDDTYIGTQQGVNGGAKSALGNALFILGFYNADLLPGRGLLHDVYGDDTYRAERRGINGGGDLQLGGSGLLLDENGTDSYFDLEGGTGMDNTVLPKGTGAQLDRESHELPVL